MATGTNLPHGGGHRLTAGRRASLAALAVVWAFTATMAGVSPVFAAENWSREVRFSETSEDPSVRWGSSFQDAGDCTSSDPIATEYARYKGDEPTAGARPWNLGTDAQVTYDDGTVDPPAPEAGFYGCWLHSGSNPIGFSVAEGGVWPYNTNGSPGSGLTEPLTIRVHFSGTDWASQPRCSIQFMTWEHYNEGPTTTESVIATSVRYEGFATTQDLEVPAGSRLYGFVIQSGCALTHVAVNDITELVGGSCAGVAGPGTDAGLVIPAAGLAHLSDHDEWGDTYLPAVEACVFTRDGFYRYYPPEGVVEGETYSASVEVSSSSSTPCNVLIQWGGSGPAVNIVQHTWTGANPGGAAGPGAKQRNSNAPAGAEYFNLTFTQQCRLHGLLLENVEGDPIRDNGSDGTGGPGPDPTGDAWDDCQPGQDFLAVGEWVAYAACLIAGLPLAIATLISGILADLFVPKTIGTRWASFMAMAETKAPFGWFAQVVASIESSAGAGASALGSFNLTVGSATVSIGAGIQSALGAVQPFRGLIFAGVAMTMGLGCLHWIMAAVGVSPSKPAGGEQA